MRTTRHTDTVEVIVKGQRRRRCFSAEKAARVRRTDEPGLSVSLAQVSAPRRCGGLLVVPVENTGSPSCSGCWARRPWRTKFSRKPWRVPPQKSGWRARPCCAGTNGSADIAADTRALARSLGLRPINTPVCSPQSNGIAEHFNELLPHSSLTMRSPREFRRHQAAAARRSTVQEAVIHCE